jgi:hypothetical protein
MRPALRFQGRRSRCPFYAPAGRAVPDAARIGPTRRDATRPVLSVSSAQMPARHAMSAVLAFLSTAWTLATKASEPRARRPPES